MYRKVVPMPPVEWGQKASPLGVRSHALGRKLSAKQTDEVPLRWLRAFIVAEARGAAFGEDLFRHGVAAPPSPSGDGLGMPFALLLLGLCSKLTTLPCGEGTRVRQNRPRRLTENGIFPLTMPMPDVDQLVTNHKFEQIVIDV